MGAESIEPTAARVRLSRHDRALMWLFFPGFLLFLHSAAPDMTAGDAGELLCAGWTLGVPHPPGYPLWVLLNKAVCYAIPLGSLGLRGAVVSALCGGAAAGFLAVAAGRLFSSRIAGAFAGLVAIGSYTLWEQSSIAEVYALNGAICAALLAVYSMSEKSRAPLMCLLAGLGVANHQTSILVAGPLLMGLLVTGKSWRSMARSFPAWVGLGIIGGAVYLATTIRSNADPAMNWGLPKDIQGLLMHVMRKQYGTPWAGERSLSLSLLELQSYGRSVVSQWGPVLIWLAIPGWVRLFRRCEGTCLRTHVPLLFLAIGLLTGPGLTLLLNPELEREALDAVSVFYIPSHLVAALFIGGGLAACVRESVASRLLGFARESRTSAMLNWVPSLLVLVPLVQSRDLATRRSDWTASNYARDLLTTAGRRSLLFTSSDNQGFPLAFAQIVEGRSENVECLDAAGDPYLPVWAQRPASVSEDSIAAKRAEFVAGRMREAGSQAIFLSRASSPRFPGMWLAPYGLGYRMQSESMPSVGLDLWPRFLGGPRLPLRDYANDMIASDYVVFRGLALLEAGNTTDAFLAFEEAQGIGHGVKELYNNIGSILAERRLLEGAKRQYEKALRVNPRYALARANLGRVCLELGEPKEAIVHLESAANAAPGSWPIWNDLGRALSVVGLADDAKGAWRRSLEIFPDQPEVREWLEGSVRGRSEHDGF